MRPYLRGAPARPLASEARRRASTLPQEEITGSPVEGKALRGPSSPSLPRSLTELEVAPRAHLKVRMSFSLTAVDLTRGQVQFAAKQALMGRLHLLSDAIYVTADPLHIPPRFTGWIITATLHANATQMEGVRSRVDEYEDNPDSFGKALSERLVAVNADWKSIHDSFEMLSFEKIPDHPVETTTVPPLTTTTPVPDTTTIQPTLAPTTTVAVASTSPLTSTSTATATTVASTSTSSSTSATTTATSTQTAGSSTTTTTAATTSTSTTSATSTSTTSSTSTSTTSTSQPLPVATGTLAFGGAETVLVLSVAAVAVCFGLLAGLCARRLWKRAKAAAAGAKAAEAGDVEAPPTVVGVAAVDPEVESHGPIVGCQRSEPVDLRPPHYWKHQECGEVMARADVSMDARQAVQELLDTTFRRVTTRDRRSGPMPIRLRVRQVQRIENSSIWQRYARERHEIRSKRPFRCTPVAAVIGDSLRTSMNDSGYALEDQVAAAGNVVLPESMQKGVNEVYLWHGTSPQRALSIVKNGFQLKYSGTGAGSAMYGDGVYLAECSSKADEYAQDDPKDFASFSCLLLCRVVLGEVLKMTTGGEATHAMIKAATASGAYDSVLGDREVSVGTYREFVAYKEAQVYPEYLVLYSRETTSMMSTMVSAEADLPPVASASTGSSSSTGGVALGAVAEDDSGFWV